MDQPTNHSTAHAYSECPAPRVSTLVPFIETIADPLSHFLCRLQIQHYHDTYFYVHTIHHLPSQPQYFMLILQILMSVHLDYTHVVCMHSVITRMAPSSAPASMAILEMDIIAVGFIVLCGYSINHNMSTFHYA